MYQKRAQLTVAAYRRKVMEMTNFTRGENLLTTAKHKLTALLTLLKGYMASLFFSLSLILFCQLQHFGGIV